MAVAQTIKHAHPSSNAMLSGLLTGSYRFNEKLIRPASAIYALGLFRTIRHTPSTDDIDKRINNLLGQWKLRSHKYLAQCGIDENGKIQKQEWRVIRHQPRQQVLASIEQKQALNLLSRPAEDGPPFILSAVGEKKLVFRKKLIVVSTAGIALVLFVILVNLIKVRALT